MFSFFRNKKRVINASKNWYYMVTSANQIDVDIYDEIGGYGITAKDFIADVKSQGEDKPLVLHIHSPGGEVFEGFAIMTYLNNYKATTTACVEGIAASMASLIALSCNAVKMAEQGYLMIHNPLAGIMGNATELRKQADILDKLTDTAVKTYAKKFTKLTSEKIKELMDAETWINLEDCKGYGLSIESLGKANITQKFDLKSNYKNLPTNILDSFDITGKSQADKLNEEIERLKQENEILRKIKLENKQAENELTKELNKLQAVNISAKSESGSMTFNKMIQVFVKDGIEWKQAYNKVKAEYPELYAASVIKKR